MTNVLAALASFCTANDLPWDEGRAQKMEGYLDLLMQFNEAMNLIGPLTRQAVVDELLVDSLVAAAARRPEGPMLDVGTGAGLPGIPLKIVFPDVALTLVEPRQKRSTFLKIAIHRLSLSSVTAFRGRIEDFDGARFDTVISKAFQPPEDWLQTAKPFAADTGAIICMARRRDAQGLLEVAGELGLRLAGSAGRGAESPTQRVCYVFEPSVAPQN